MKLMPQIAILKKAIEKKKEQRKTVKKSTRKKVASMFSNEATIIELPVMTKSQSETAMSPLKVKSL